MGILIAALTPSIFWLWFFTRFKAYRPRPRSIIIITFFLGMLLTIPALLLEFLLIPISSSIGTLAAFYFIVGPVEELSKYIAVRLRASGSLYFEEPRDGLIYAAAASFGFATIENIFYISQFGTEVIFIRGPLSTLAHFVFGSVWGLAMGMSVQGKVPRWVPLLLGVPIAAFLHGSFNILVSIDSIWGTPAAISLISAGAVLVIAMFKWANFVSPFRSRRNNPLSICSICKSTGRFAKECTSCGASQSEFAGKIICSFCGHSTTSQDHFCGRCGDQFIRLQAPPKNRAVIQKLKS